jgi:hypothetical protein
MRFLRDSRRVALSSPELKAFRFSNTRVPVGSLCLTSLVREFSEIPLA